MIHSFGRLDENLFFRNLILNQVEVTDLKYWVEFGSEETFSFVWEQEDCLRILQSTLTVKISLVLRCQRGHLSLTKQFFFPICKSLPWKTSPPHTHIHIYVHTCTSFLLFHFSPLCVYRLHICVFMYLCVQIYRKSKLDRKECMSLFLN